MNDIVQIISTVGFPIVVSGALGWYIVRQADQHKTETQGFTDALNKNTLVLQQLTDTIAALEDDKNDH